jgi:hypothetical protein
MFERMSHVLSRRVVTMAQSWALVAVPGLLLVVGVMHFRRLSDFFAFRARYEPASATDTVRRLIAAGDGAPLLHEPHMIAYLGLPLIPLAAFALYALGKGARPLASLAALAATLVGTVYLGGLFGMWTAFFHGLGGVDAQHTDGAIATFAALTAPRGAFLLTTTLAKLAMVGLLLQTVTLVRLPGIPMWAPLVAAAGCLLVLAFWDLDNWMMVGEAMIFAGMWPLRAVRLSIG